MIVLDTDKVYSVSDTKWIIEAALKKGTVYKSEKVRYHNIICAFDIETSNIRILSDNEYKDLYIYNYLKGITIRCIDVDITAFKTPDGIKLSKTKGEYLDELYQELCDIFPGMVREGLLSPDEQLRSILTLYSDNTPYDNEEHYSIMYCWQFAINGKVIFGRTWAEFIELYDIITNYSSLENRIIVWVHNLNMEMQYIRMLLNWHKVFAVATRKPLYAVTEQGIEFRCSYLLSGYSLAKVGENLHIYDISKLVGALDYSLYRSSETPMNQQEISYCINDVLVVSAYIQECIIDEEKNHHGSLATIPYTATGYCRRYVRSMCLPKGKKNHKKWQEYHALMLSLQIKDAEEYKQCNRAFAGGFTHTSSLWAGKTIPNMDSIDFTSAYIFTMMSECNFPMSAGKIVELHSEEEFRYYLKYYCCIFDLEIFDLNPKFINDNYISTSHCIGLEKGTFTASNGRLVKAKHFFTTITEIDFEIIEKTYSMKKIKIHNFRIYKKGYLPKPFILSLIKLYKDKTTLKGVPDKEVEYMHSKSLLNACFGMICMDISKDEVIYIDDHWDIEKANIQKNIEKYNKSPKRFLFYPWAIYITALSRRNLWSGILEFGDDYVYSDTDSIKCMNIGKHINYITRYNKQCEVKLRLMCKHYDIDYESELLPKTIDGETKPLGVWDYDGHYDKFKALRSKAYMGQKGDNIVLTVSGVNKKVAVPYLLKTYGLENIFEKFSNGLCLPEGTTGKLLHCYIDHFQSGSFTDYLGNEYTFNNEPPAIYLEDTSYDFDITQEYLDYLKGVQHVK